MWVWARNASNDSSLYWGSLALCLQNYCFWFTATQPWQQLRVIVMYIYCTCSFVVASPCGQISAVSRTTASLSYFFFHASASLHDNCMRNMGRHLENVQAHPASQCSNKLVEIAAFVIGVADCHNLHWAFGTSFDQCHYANMTSPNGDTIWCTAEKKWFQLLLNRTANHFIISTGCPLTGWTWCFIA